RQPKLKAAPAREASSEAGSPPAGIKMPNADNQTGIMAGTREIFHGMATATRGAASDLIGPTRKIGTGLSNGSKMFGHELAEGARTSGQIVTKETQAISNGVK